jgi:two-component sensor histidine kinase
VAREMYHRVNNTLATVQAIMSSTLRNAGTLENFEASFTARIQALSRTHLMLTKHSQAAIGLREMLENELDLYADGNDDRVSLSGPPLILPERLAIPVGMAIHELATNAAKYGALSLSGGSLSVIWAQAGATLALVWRERNVYRAGASTRVGFGTQLLREVLPMQIGARIEMRYEPDGLNAQIVVPLAE